MRTLYIDCSMGAAGDMLTAALLELFDDKESIVKELNSLGIPKVKYVISSEAKCGIVGTHVKVTVDGVEEDEHMHDHHHDHDHDHDHEHHHEHDHEHSSLHDIEHIIRDHLGLCNSVTEDIMAVYRLIGEAESAAHGRPINEIHFHEVGTMDAVADITAVCYLIDKLKVDKIVASPIHVGSGTVKCAHGILPVPAPATAYILKGVPTYGGEIKSELCTPTGAALLKHFVSSFGSQPSMCVDKIGYGMGKKDFEAANCVRVLLGEDTDGDDNVIELEANIDDMTGEDVAFAAEKLFEEGAREVFTIPVYMKKSRPGNLMCIICDKSKEEDMVKAIFKYTSTIGIRKKNIERYILDRKIEKKITKYGDIRVKVSEGYGVRREKYEYDDISAIASREGKSIGYIRKELGGN